MLFSLAVRGLPDGPCDWITRLVQAAIESLMTRVQAQTYIDVQDVRKKCDLLPAMNQKLDTIVGLQREQSEKLDQIVQFQAQQTRRGQAAHRKDSSLKEHCIPQAQVKTEPEPFARGASSQVYMVSQ